MRFSTGRANPPDEPRLVEDDSPYLEAVILALPMTKSRALLQLTALFIALAPATLRPSEVQEARSLITATDLLKVQQLESPALSPDGKLVAYVVRSIEPKPNAKDDWEYRTHLWLAATDGSAPPRQLTQSGNNSAPAWSPDGTRLAFLRTIEKEKPQVLIMPLTGGEAWALTKLETGAGSPRWSPDGTQILFTSSLSYAQVRAALEKAGLEAKPKWSPERSGREANDTANWAHKSKDKDDADKKPKVDPDGSMAERREWLARNEADASPRVTTRLNFFGETDLQPSESISQLFVVEVKEGSEPRNIAPGYTAHADAEWLPDGKSVVATGPRSLTEHPDRERFRSLHLIDVMTGESRTLLDRADENYDNPTPSPDGKWIAFTVQTGGLFSFSQAAVAVVPAAGGEPRILTAALDRVAQNLKWNPDSRSIYFTTPSKGGFPLRSVDVEGGEPRKLTENPEWGVRDYDITGGALAQVVTRPENPYELLAGEAGGDGPRELTTHNSAWLAGKKLSTYEPHRLVNSEGITVDYWTLKPADFDPAKKYPLLLQIHGGPSAMWGPGEDTMWHEFQYYAARGYVVVFANPRGSGGYGRDFQKANYKDWGTGPASDVLNAARFSAQNPCVDTDRQVVTGGSYGGYLTAWIVGHDQRFKAAVAQRGVYDLATFFGEGNAWFLVPLYFGGYPWEEDTRRLLERESPLTYVADIKTPLLIQHGDVDLRTGVIQSQMLHKSLKALGRPVEYARYPRASHEMSRSGEPKQRLDSLVRYEEFFRRHIGDN